MHVPLRFIFSLLIVAAAIILSAKHNSVLNSARNLVRRFYSAEVSNHLIRTGSMSPKTPIYFLSHGGPNIMYEKDHPVYPKLQEIGREITQKVRPKAIVVFSAHWQGGKDVIEVNTAEDTDLIYDFYGFPSHYYKETYPNKGSFVYAQKVIDTLAAAGIKTKATKRGLDHGVWASFKVAFPPSNPLNVPVIQASLFATEDPAQHLALGRAVSSLRDQGILLIMSGMAVHNLRDMRFGFDRKQPYAESFDKALREAVEIDGPESQREGKMVELLRRKDARPAHPSFEHLLPVHIGVGAAGEESGKQLWTLVEGSFSWAQFRWGDVPALPVSA